jgi:hypothetical protein
MTYETKYRTENGRTTVVPAEPETKNQKADAGKSAASKTETKQEEK